MVCKKKMMWIFSSICVIILCVCIFLYLISAPYELHSNDNRHVSIEKIAISVLLDKDVLLSDEELESLIVQVLPVEWNNFSLRSDLDEEKFHLCISVPHNKKNFFVSVDILPEISQNNIILKLSNAHIGRLPVPVNFILKQIQDIKVSGDSIVVPNEWCFSIHGICTQVHVKKFQKVSDCGAKVRFQANITK